MTQDIQAIQDELAANAARQAALQAALIEKQQAAKAGAVEQVREIVTAYALTADDLAVLFAKQPRKAATEKAVRAVYRDTVTGHEYKGGKLPAWLQGRLAETGLAYEQYRELHFQRVN